MENKKTPYNNLASYLRSKYGGKIKKICIDAGFTCPNRDGTCGVGGCIFCGERGAGEHIDASAGIEIQVKRFFEDPPPADGYIAYFQNFTNTYASPPVLKERYDRALTDPRIKVLAIGTRADCISEQVARLIASYKDRVDVWVELGLQSASDKTAQIINRGYKTEVFESAVNLLHSYGIPIVVHLMIGLPGESDGELKETVALINRLPVWGIKLHSVFVMKGTRLAEMYGSGEYMPISKDDYIRRCVYAISHLRKDIIIHRLTGDCPRELLVAPQWSREKSKVIAQICATLEADGLSQGDLFGS